MEKDYSKMKAKVISILERRQSIVLATSFNNKVTARTISHVNEGLTIFFQSSGGSEKAQQMLHNPNVAIAVSNIQMEAVVEDCGHPCDPNNKNIIEKYKNKYPAYFEKYSNLPDEILFKVVPTKIKLYSYTDNKPNIVVMDIINARVLVED